MISNLRKWWHLFKHAQHLNILLSAINEGGRVTVFAHEREVTLCETERGYTVTIAPEGSGDDPTSCTYHAWFGEAFADWAQAAYDINNTPRLWDDGAEYMRVE